MIASPLASITRWHGKAVLWAPKEELTRPSLRGRSLPVWAASMRDG